MSLASQITAGFAAVAAQFNTIKHKRLVSITSSATPSINTDVTDIFKITALAVNITSMTTNLTGTPTAGDELHIIIIPNGTIRTIAWGTKFEASTTILPVQTPTAAGRFDMKFIWNNDSSKWRILAVA